MTLEVGWNSVICRFFMKEILIVYILDTGHFDLTAAQQLYYKRFFKLLTWYTCYCC